MWSCYVGATVCSNSCNVCLSVAEEVLYLHSVDVDGLCIHSAVVESLCRSSVERVSIDDLSCCW